MKEVLNFLKQLSKNNNKEWFDLNKNSYLQAKETFESIVQPTITAISKFDKQIDVNLEAKKCTFRIYKDVRFSKDKSPYKTNMGASINPGGKKSLLAGYYLHIEPGKSFLAGGVYMPEPEVLQAIRQEIDYNGDALLKILTATSFKKYFKGIDEDGKLKTVPKGYDKEHKHLELLKNKHFILLYNLKDSQILDNNFVKEISLVYKAMIPFLDYLRQATAK